MAEWLNLKHEETGGTTRIPDDPGVLAVHQARGWSVVEDDGEPDQPFVPASTDAAESGEPWVDLVHPDLPTGHQRVPNHPDALAGAFEAGWQLPDPDPALVAEVAAELRADAGKRPGKPTKAEREQAEQIAAVQGAATDEPPAVPTAGDDDAGDGTSPKEH